MSWIKWIMVSCLAFLTLTALLVWLVLSSTLLAGVRGHLTETLLAKKLGNAIRIDGGVWMEPGKDLLVTVEKLALLSPSMADTDLVNINKVVFSVPLGDLLRGKLELHDIAVNGASATLVAQQDGRMSWIAAPGTATNKTGGVSGSKGLEVMRFLETHRIAFADSGVSYQDARNGLELELQLETLELGRLGDKTKPEVAIQGKGVLNGQDVTVSGRFPEGQPFAFKTIFSHVEIDLQGSLEQGGIEDGYKIDLDVDIADLNQLLAILKLSGDVTGTGKITASVNKTTNGTTAQSDLEFKLQGGESLTVSADIKDLATPGDATILTKLRLYSDGNEPPVTHTRSDLKLVGIDMDLTSRPGQQPLRSMVISTNGFVLDTGGVGPPPISVTEISRTSDGKLRIGKAEVRIGAPESPILVLEGAVGDLLALDGFDFTGKMDSPAGNLIAPQQLQSDAALGRMIGSFQLNGNTKVLHLSALKATSKDTDLWTLMATGSVENILKFDTVALDIAAEVASVSTFLKALNLQPGDDIPAKLELKLSSHDTEWKSSAVVTVAESEVKANLSVQATVQNPTVRGTITSDLIRIDQLRDLVLAGVQLSKLDNKSTATQPDQETTESNVEPKSAAAGPFRDITLQPIGQAILLSNMDVDIKIDLKKIEGDGSSGSIDSELVVKEQKASLGPVKFSYGGASFDVSAAMDMAENPEVLSLKGSTGGWDFSHILELLKFKKHASGILSASFDISGHHASVKKYMSTMTGYGTVTMHKGSIQSQLLDLAGLGVVPWLFEKGSKKSAEIVCLKAPISVSGGRFNLKNGVIETDKVQVVVQGDVNLGKDTVNITGQPRRIGKPLSRSPWPFAVAGSLNNPKVKVKTGQNRERRSDGASTMPAHRKPCVPDILQLE